MLNPKAFGGISPSGPPYQGFALDPLGALSGPQTPRPIILHPPFLIPGYGPDVMFISLFELDVLRYRTLTEVKHHEYATG